MTELEKRIELWKSELLDTGKRNKMINYRDSKLTTLTITEPAADDLFDRIAIHEKTLKFMKRIDKESDIRVSAMLSLLETLSFPLVVEEGDIRSNTTELERNKTLKNLRSKAKLAQEEQGTNILYLCFGFIYWREKPGTSWLKSPLLLVPVTVSQASLKAPFTLSRYDDDVVVNPTLDYRFNSEFNIALPSFELGKDKFQDYMDEVESLVDKKGWRLARNEVSLGLLSFLKISMYHDLDDNKDLILGNPVLQAIAGESETDPSILKKYKDIDFDTIHPKDSYEVVDADSSQEEAIALSRAGISFVMQGPPGTGKSQTITNIIAAALADRKKVLFVSEKAAALQVVLKRLTETNLADFCLSLHNYKANKKDIIHNIGDNLYLSEENEQSIALLSLTRLMEDKKFINTYAQQLHRIIEPFGQSVYMAYGRLMQYDKSTYISFPFPDIQSTTFEQHGIYHQLVSDFDRALKNLTVKITDSPWYGTVTKVSNQAYKNYLEDKTSGLKTDLESIMSLLNTLQQDYHIAVKYRWNDIQDVIAEIRKFLLLGMFPSAWLDRTQRKVLIAKASDKQQKRGAIQAKEISLRNICHEGIYEADTDEWQTRANEISQAFSNLHFAFHSNPSRYQYALEHISAWEDTIALLQRVQVEYNAFGNQFEISLPPTFQNVQRISKLLTLIASKPSYSNGSWFSQKVISRIADRLNEAEQQSIQKKKLWGDLSTVWDAGIISINANELQENVLDIYPSNVRGDLRKYAQKANEKSITLIHVIKELISRCSIAQQLLHFNGVVDFELAKRLSSLLFDLSRITYIEKNWMDIRKVKKLRSILSESLSHYQKYKIAKEKILEQWNDRVFELNIPLISLRSRTKYDTSFIEALNQYQKDVQLLQSCSLRVSEQVSADSVLVLSRALSEVEATTSRFEKLSNDYAETVNFGIDTNWKALNTSQAAENTTKISLLEEAALHTKAYLEVKELLKDWTPDCFDLDAESMLARFAKDYKAFLAHMLNAQYKQDIALIRTKLKIPSSTVSDEKIVSSLSYIVRGKAELRWFSEHDAELRARFGERYSGSETNWTAIKLDLDRKYQEVQNVLYDAETIANKINALKTEIALSWDNVIYQVDVVPVFERYRTIYSYQFFESLNEYQHDLEQLRAASRTLLDSVSYEMISQVASSLESLRHEENWFADQTQLHRDAFGSAYQGLKTDWKLLMDDFEAAAQIIDYFPYGNISSDTLDAICQIVAEPQLASTARELADSLHSMNIGDITAELDQIGDAPFDISTSSLTDVVVPWLQQFVESALMTKSLLDGIASLKKSQGELTYSEVQNLVSGIKQLDECNKWFADYRTQNAEYFGTAYCDENTEWNTVHQGVMYAYEVTSLLSDQIISDSLLSLLQCGLSANHCMVYESLISYPELRLLHTVQEYILHVDNNSAIAPVLLQMQGLFAAASSLKSLIGHVSAYLQKSEPNADDIMYDLPIIIDISRQRKEEVKDSGECEVSFGSLYQGTKTDWANILLAPNSQQIT